MLPSENKASIEGSRADEWSVIPSDGQGWRWEGKEKIDGNLYVHIWGG